MKAYENPFLTTLIGLNYGVKTVKRSIDMKGELKTEMRFLVPIDIATWILEEKSKNNTTVSQIVVKALRLLKEASE